MLWKLVKWGLLGLVVHHVCWILIDLDLNKRIYNHSPGPCQHVEGIEEGSEDVEVLPDGTAFISSGLIFANKHEQGIIKGRIFFYDFNANQTKPKAEELKIDWKSPEKESFNPIGMSYFIDKQGTVHLYVVNLLFGTNSVVERFEFDKKTKTLVHTKTFRDPQLRVLDDIVVVDKDKFFATNLNHYSNEFVKIVVEFWFLIKMGSVVYFDGTKGHIVASRLGQPNGIILSKDKKKLYVALSLDRLINVYSFDGKELEKQEEISLTSAIDNLFIDENDDLWTAAHPVKYIVVGHFLEPRNTIAPSQVLRMRKEGSEWSVTELYANEGKELSASTVAVFYKGQMLVGTVHRQLLHCSVVCDA